MQTLKRIAWFIVLALWILVLMLITSQLFLATKL